MGSWKAKKGVSQGSPEGTGRRRSQVKGPLALLSRSRLFAIPARRTTTGPVETHRGGRRRSRPAPRALTRFSNFLWQGVGQAPPLPVKHKYTVLRIAYSCVLRIGGLGLWPALRNIPYNCFAYCVLRIEAWLLAHAGCAFCVLRFLRFGALQREQKAC